LPPSVSLGLLFKPLRAPLDRLLIGPSGAIPLGSDAFRNPFLFFQRTLDKGRMMGEPVIRARIIVEAEEAEPVGYGRLSKRIKVIGSLIDQACHPFSAPSPNAI
jgi:hypothetical protein